MADIKGFVTQYAPVASQVSQQIGVAPDVLLGQWGLETGWGKSVIPGTNNLGNIKGPGVAATDNQTGSNDQYRQYSTPQAFGNDFASLIGRRYQGATGTGSDANAFGAALSKGGYAEDPNYANKLTSAVGMVRKFGDALASAFSGTANASELTPAQMSDAPVISATGQRINMPQAQQQAAPQQSAPVSTGDPLLDMAHGMLSGSAPAAQPATAAAPTDDPLLAMAHNVLASKDTAPAATQAAPSTPGQPAFNPTGTLDGGQWKTPGSVIMGIGDQIKGGVQTLLHGGASLANTIAPNSQFAKDITAAVPQVDQTIQSQDAQYSAQRAAQGGSGFDYGRFAGNYAGAAPFAAGAGAGVLGGILGGAVGGVMQPVANAGDDYAHQKSMQVGAGAALGGIASPIANALGRVISPTIGAAQRTLIDAGVPLTPGQILGGAAARTEAKLTSVPFLGDMIKNGQQRAVQGFNQATYDQVLAPLGQKYSGPIGNEGVANVQKTISNAYDDALSKLTFHADPQFTTDMANLGGMAQSLPAAQQSQFLSIIKNQIAGKLSPQGTMDGQTLKGVQSELGRISKGLTGDPSYDNQQLGQAVAQVKNLVEGALPRSNPADAVSDLANANAAYANFVRLRGAAGSQGAMNNDGVFTAGQLNNAVRGADKSAGKGATATGNALMQDFSSAGQSVLGSKYPDSGTPGRSLLALMGPAALGNAFAPGVAAPMAAALGAGALPYTAMGQKVAQALLTSRPGIALPVRNALTQYGVPVAGPAANALFQAIARPQN